MKITFWEGFVFCPLLIFVTVTWHWRTESQNGRGWKGPLWVI